MKRIALVMVLSCFFVVLCSRVYAVELPLRVVVNGEKIVFPDAQPFIDSNGRTQTPARFIGEALGATVTWQGDAQKAIFETGGKKLVLYIGKKEYDLNNEKKHMDTVALLQNGRTFVPARYVAEAFGATVKWDSAVRTVYVDMIKKDDNKEGTEVIAGFNVPLKTELLVLIPDNKTAEIAFMVDLLSPDLEGQILDLENILSQKCSDVTVKNVISHVKKKETRRYVLEEKLIFDDKSQRCIWIHESYDADINIYYLTEEDSKGYESYKN